jgi:hypothetical protein
MNKTINTLVLTLAVSGFVGCNTQGRVETHFGEAYREAVARSTDDPEGAAANADRPAPSGTDGVTAQQSLGRYRAGLQPGAAPELPLPLIVTDSDSLSSD